ncbi:hypothetical protein M2140_000143 [Clostridiales Family XIII bacterium PM5-7]
MGKNMKVGTTPTQNKIKRNHDELIECKSVRFGHLRYESKKTGNIYEWSNFGDLVMVEYGDLLPLKASKSKFLLEPWFLIEDDELIEEWGLGEIYSYYNEFDDVEDFLRQDAKTIRKKLPRAPKGYKDLIAQTAGRMLRDGGLDSLASVKVIDDVLNTSLKELIGGE